MASIGAVVQSRTPDQLIGEGTLATLRVRTKVLEERLAASSYKSQEQFIRAANISRTAWNALLDEDKKRVDLRVLASVLKALDLTLADVLEYDPDEKAT